MTKKIIKVPVYNFNGNDVSMNDKRLYSDWVFEVICPHCCSLNIYKPRTYTFLYVPNTFKHVNFCCNNCEQSYKLFFLEDIKDDHALVYKNPEFEGNITILKTLA